MIWFQRIYPMLSYFLPFLNYICSKLIQLRFLALILAIAFLRTHAHMSCEVRQCHHLHSNQRGKRQYYPYFDQ